MPDVLDLDVVVTRGDDIESRHRVHAVIANARGDILARARDGQESVWWRSCAKLFQIMPLLHSGGFARLDWGDDQLAVACASHGGEPEHLAIVRAMLEDIDLEEGDLACGPHEPLTVRGQQALRESGERPSRLYNNCSGKHAAMLGLAVTSGWPTIGYERADHPVQRSILESIATWCGLEPRDIREAVDGCGVVVHGLPLRNMAIAYARLAEDMRSPESFGGRIRRAVRARPMLIGGTDRFDSILIEETGGSVISKVGAEGVHCAAVPELGLGFAVKVEDGAQRAQYPALLHLLQRVQALPETLPVRLADALEHPIRNTRGEIVGALRLAQ